MGAADRPSSAPQPVHEYFTAFLTEGFATRTYLALFQTPGALAFCAAAFFARAGGAMMGVGTVLMVSALYGSYGWAGFLTAANGLAWAVGNATLARMVDRHGQSRVMVPATVASALSLTCLVIAAWLRAPVWVLFAPAILAGATGGSASSLVRARWNYALKDSAQLHAAFSLESTLDEVTYIVGPVVATALATMVHPTAGLMAPIVLGLGGGLWFYYALRGSQPPVGRPIATPVTDGTATSPHIARPVQRDRFVLAFGGMLPLVAVTALFGCCFGAIDVSTVAATSAWDARPMAGLVLAAMSVGSAVAGLGYGILRWSTPLARRFVIGVAFYAGLVSLLLFAHTVAILTLVGFLAGSAVAPSFTNANSLVTVLVPNHRLTEGLAWIGTSIGIGASLGSSVAGRLIDSFGYHGGYWTAVIAAASSLALALLGTRAIQRNVGLQTA